MNILHPKARPILSGLLILLGLWGAAPPLSAHDKDSEGESAEAEASQGQDGDRHGKDEKDDPPFGGVTADELSEKDIERVMEVLDAANPQMAQRLRDVRRQSEPEFREALAEVASSRRIRWLMMQKKFDPEGFRLRAAEYRIRHRIDRVTDRLAETGTDSEEAEELKHDLRNLLGDAFEARQRVREHELARLERRIEDLRSELQEKNQRKEELIEQRYQELLKDPSDYEYRRKKGRKYKDDGDEKKGNGKEKQKEKRDGDDS